MTYLFSAMTTLIEMAIYYLLTESEVITGKSQTEVLAVRTERSEVRTNKTEVWDFPVMTERTRLISYLLYGFFQKYILRKKM